MNRLFIIEGPDASGKSSLAKRICLMKKAIYLHATGVSTLHPAMTAYHLNMIDIAKVNLENGHDVVMDRHWPSEEVYGKIFRPEISMSYDFYKVISATQELKPTYVFCGDDQVELRHAAEADPAHPYSTEAFHQVVLAYAELEHDMMTGHYITQPGKNHIFDIRSYSILEHGTRMAEFVEKL